MLILTVPDQLASIKSTRFLYRRAATRARTAPSPPRAMVFRLAEEPVLDGVGGPVVVTFDPPVGTETAVDIVVEAAAVVSTVATVVETSVDTDTELEGT